MTILLLVEDLVQIESLTRGLRSKGHKVQHSSNGQDAMRILENSDQRIDVIITDYAMSIREGKGLVRHIQETFDDLPVIVMTGSGGLTRLINPLCSLSCIFIEKPFTLDELAQLIERSPGKDIQELSEGRTPHTRGKAEETIPKTGCKQAKRLFAERR
jgi:two-component system cell cycle sensor histidine kinase/response regulator CckA